MSILKKLSITKGPWGMGCFGDGTVTSISSSINGNMICNFTNIKRLRYHDNNDYENARLIITAPEILEAFEKTWREFRRLKNESKTIKDKLYLDGVLSVIKSIWKEPIEKATDKPWKEIEKLLED